MEEPKLSKDFNCLMGSKIVDLRLPEDIKNLLVEVSEGTPQYICTTTKGGPQSIIRSMQLLENSLSCIGTALHSEVVACHEHLLHNVSSIDKLQSELDSIQESIQSVAGVLSRVHRSTVNPIKDVRTMLRTLRRLITAQEVLQNCRRFASSARIVKAQMDCNGRDLPKAAATLSEINSFIDPKLRRVEIVAEQLQWVSLVSEAVRKEAEDKFRKGLSELNRIDLSVSCRVFYNLGDLPEVVEGYVVSVMEDVAKTCNLNGDDSHVPIKQQFIQFASNLKGQMQRTLVLQQVIGLLKTDGPAGSKALPQQALPHLIWRQAGCLLAEMVQKVATSNDDFNRRLAAKYPEILQVLIECTNSVEKIFASPSPENASFELDDLSCLVAGVKRWESAYIQLVQTRINYTLSSCFPNVASLPPLPCNFTPDLLLDIFTAKRDKHLAEKPQILKNVPTPADVQLFMRTINEFATIPEAMPDDLIDSVASILNTAIVHFAYTLVSGMHPSALTISISIDYETNNPQVEAATLAHAVNAAIAEALRALGGSTDQFPNKGIRCQIAKTIHCINSIRDDIIAGWTRPVLDVVCEKLLPQMHVELANLEGQNTTAANGKYMSQIKEVLVQSSFSFYGALGTHSSQSIVVDLCSKIMQVFIVHVALVKPLSPEIREVVAGYITSLEVSLRSVLPPISTHLRQQCGALESLRRLMFLENANILPKEFNILEYLPVFIVALHIWGRIDDASLPSLPETLSVPMPQLAIGLARWLSLPKGPVSDNSTYPCPSEVVSHVLRLVESLAHPNNSTWLPVLRRLTQ